MLTPLLLGGSLGKIADIPAPLADKIGAPRVQLVEMDTEQAKQFTKHCDLLVLT